MFSEKTTEFSYILTFSLFSLFKSNKDGFYCKNLCKNPVSGLLHFLFAVSDVRGDLQISYTLNLFIINYLSTLCKNVSKKYTYIKF